MKLTALVFFLFLLPAALTVAGQEPKAIKIDEFTNTNCDDYGSRIDASLNEVSKSPDAKGYFLVYSGEVRKAITDRNTVTTLGWRYVKPEVDLATDLIAYFKTHLAFRNFPADRVVFVEAGFREKFLVEVWLVPPGAESPKPSPTLTKMKQSKRTKRPLGYCGEM